MQSSRKQIFIMLAMAILLLSSCSVHKLTDLKNNNSKQQEVAFEELQQVNQAHVLHENKIQQQSKKGAGELDMDILNQNECMYTYNEVGDVKLELKVFKPSGWKKEDKRAAIVFFFGGGWTNGTMKQFENQSKYLASKGMVAITADYRVKSRQGTTPIESVEDAKAAIAWTRKHAEELGIDPNRIASSGGSAGGHIAACTAVTGVSVGKEYEQDCVPNAMILYNPVLDLVDLFKQSESKRVEDLNKRFSEEQIHTFINEISPARHVKEGFPPTIIFFGTNDRLLEYSMLFCEEMEKKNNECKLVTYEGRGHGFFNIGKPEYENVLKKTEEFLKSVGYINE